MRIKTKLTSGIGILFLIIVLMGTLSVGYIYKLSADTQNILADNYNSLDYAKRMLQAVEQIETDQSAIQVFIENLERQRKNITEIDESEVTERLIRHFRLLQESRSEELFNRSAWI